MKAWESGSEQQLELGRNAFAHPPSLTFCERIPSDALKEHIGKVIGGRTITNLKSIDENHALAEEEQEFEALVESLC